MPEGSPLASLAHTILIEDLTAYGNQLSADHSAALAALVQDFSDMAMGNLSGRWAWGLPTGTGKSAAVVAWITAASRSGADVSVAVSASKVEALCEMKRTLIAHGVPSEDIGLLHSYRHNPKRARAGVIGYATEPSEGTGRRFMLVTHSRVHGVNQEFMQYKGQRRDLLIYDESLLTSSATGLSLSSIRGAIGFLSGTYEDRVDYQEMLGYLTGLRSFLIDSLAAIPEGQDSAIIEIPQHPKAQEWVPIAGLSDAAAPVLSLFEMNGKQARITRSGVLSYRLSVPEELANVIILDASYPIRTLERLDETIHDATSRVVGLGPMLAGMKKFNSVVVHHLRAPGGRTNMVKEFSQNRHQKGILRDVVQAIKEVPADEAILVFVYKAKHGTDFVRTLFNELESVGIDTDQEVTSHTGEQRKRINVLTWGNETGLNDFNHCRNVILAGVLHRSTPDLQACILGQSNNLSAEISGHSLREVEVSERVHLAYQALSRGACRLSSNGEAHRMHAYVIEGSKDFRPQLERIMPGLQWQRWGEPEDNSKVARTATTIRKFLEQFKGDRISLSKLKKAAGLLGTKADTYSAAARRAKDGLSGWGIIGRSFEKKAPLFPVTTNQDWKQNVAA